MEGNPQPEIKSVSQPPQQPPVVPQTLPESTPPPTKPKMRRKTKILIVSVALTILVIGVVGYYLYKTLQKPKTEAGQFQVGNTQPITQLQLRQSLELENNRMGDMVTLHPQIHTEDPDYFANRINDMGLKWMRLSIDTFDWIEVEDIEAYSEHHVYPEQDRAITALNDNGINVMHTIVFWDPESPSFKQEEKQDYSRFKTEDEIQRYLNYVQFIVGHFQGKIEYYEILNEPNARKGTQQYVESNDYINLARRVIPIIRQEDPEAKIVVGATTALHDPRDHEYFFNILESDVMPLVDAVSFHSLSAKSSPEFGPEDYYDYPALLQEIKDVASSHGFTGKYIAAELHFRTSESYHPHEPWVHTDIAAAKYLARGVITSLGMDFTTGLAASNKEQISVAQNLATIMAGATPVDLPLSIESEATNIRSYNFSLSNGDRLVVLWTDGVAVDNDPGVNATITIPSFSAQKVMGIDVLNGYQQDMVTSNENGDLTILKLKIRDYPLVLHITELNKD